MRVFLFLLASCSRFPFQGNLVGSSGLESLSDVPRAYAGLPFLSLLALPPNSGEFGGLKWARTTDLALIRRAL